jgi:hypothetical protein
MKVTGLVLVALGAVALAAYSPVVGGITVVGGLILLAMGTDRHLAA